MRYYILTLVTVGLLALPASAMAQQVTTYYYGAPTTYYSAPATYYSPAPYATTGPVTVGRASYYAPAPVSVYNPYGTAPYVYGRPTYPFYSTYGGTEVRVPGQPIRNTLRAIFP